MNLRRKSIQIMVKVILAFCLAALSWPSLTHADPCPSPWPDGSDCLQLGQQLVLTSLPDNFNGTLIVYAHGYVYPQVGELSLPLEEIGADNLDVINLLVNSGFGFATTSYSVNGYAVQQAEEDLIELVNHFEGLLESPELLEKVLLVGASEGGLITTRMLERHADLFDGGLAMCGPIGGMPYQLNYIGDFKVIFDYFFPSVFDFGMADVPVEACDAWESDYVPAIWRKIQSHPWKTLRLFDITDAAFDLFDATSFSETAETVLKYSTCGTNNLVAKAGGMPYDNQGTWYDASWWLNLFVERVTGTPVAQQYVAAYYQTTGELNVPLVTLHNLSDPAVPYRHEEIYKQLVAQKGKSGNLTVWPILGYGHCNFKPWQVLGAFYILLNQVNN